MPQWTITEFYGLHIIHFYTSAGKTANDECIPALQINTEIIMNVNVFSAPAIG